MVKKDQKKQLDEKMMSLEQELKRAVADYQNLEKRIQEDTGTAIFYAKANLINRILPVLDSLDQAAEGASDTEKDSGWLKGVLMSIKQLRQVLGEEGLVEIEVLGKFDPRLHEAVDIQEGEENQILQVVQRGYTLNGRVVRPAKVVVGKAKPEEISEEAKKEIETEET
ncbi:MAG: nucleotide exchange factor GrpE [bacterium]|nr:nucleotide exchange factor GrpE [bacterium]